MTRHKNEIPEQLKTKLRFHVDPNKYPTRKAMEAAIRAARRNFNQTGESIEGVKIVAFWQNPQGSEYGQQLKSTEDPGQSLKDFWLTIRSKTTHG